MSVSRRYNCLGIGHNTVIRAPPGVIDSKEVIEGWWAIDADSDRYLVLREQGQQFWVDLVSIGLHRDTQIQAFLPKFLHSVEQSTEILEWPQCGLSSVQDELKLLLLSRAEVVSNPIE